jgi:hypothetical protein
MWTGVQVSLRLVNAMWTNLDSLAFILHVFNHFYIASRLVCSFCEAMPGSQSVANTAVSSANFAVVGSVEVGRSAVYSRYNSGPGHCPGEHHLWLSRVLFTQIQISRQSVCYADRLWVQCNTLQGEKVLTFIVVKYAIHCQMLDKNTAEKYCLFSRA